MNRLFFLFLIFNSPVYSMEQSRSYGPDEDAPGEHIPSAPLEERVMDLSFFQSYDEKGNTLFHRLITKGHVDVFKRMITYYGDKCELHHHTVLRENVNGWTPLHLAASYGEDEIVSFLLEFNPLLREQRDPNGNTALHFAFYGMLGCLGEEPLIDHDDGNTHKIRKLNKYKEIIIDLVDAGCRMSDLNRDGVSPHELAMRNPTTQHLYQRMQRISDHRSAFESFK
jgi:ankyrin repeat protein